MLGEHPDELEADFQEVYGLDLYATAPTRAARLLTRLISHWDTAVYRALHADWEWQPLTAQLLGVQADALNLLWWAKTRDGSKNRHRPRSVFPRDEKPRMADAQLMTVDELREYLALPRY